MDTLSRLSEWTVAFLIALVTSGVNAAPVTGGDNASGESSLEFGASADAYRARLDAVEATSVELLAGRPAFEAKPAGDTAPGQTKAEARANPGSSRPPLLDQEPGVRALDRPSQAAAADPLHSALRTLVNVQRGSSPASEPSPPNQGSPAQHPAESAPALLASELDESLKATALDMKTAAAGVIRTVLNPTIDESGRTSFSVAGIEGFQLESNGTSLAVGFNDKPVGSINYAPRNNPALAETARAASQRHADPNAFNPLRELIEWVSATIEHPLTWLVVALVLLGRLAFAVASSRAARRNRIRVPAGRKAALAK